EDLQRRGAPRQLVVAAAASARDEVRHAATTERLARRFGARVPPIRVRAASAAPSAERVAVNGVREGCARETLGALVAAWQARHAGDPDIARAAKSIADDEIRHAALAWAILRWITPRLERQERARVSE